MNPTARFIANLLRLSIVVQPACHPHQPLAKQPAHREDGAHLNDDREHLRLLPGEVQQAAGDDQVPGAGHRDELGQSLDDAEDQRLEKIGQGRIPSSGCRRLKKRRRGTLSPPYAWQL
jgi:hypothetical protein